MFNTLKFFKGHFFIGLLLVFLGFAVQSCQDDPYLEKTENGVPIVTPKSKAYITSIQLNTYPAVTPTGDLWDTIDVVNNDTLGLPDIFFNLTDPSPDPPVFWSQNTHFSNVNDTVNYFLLDNYFVDPFGSNIDVNIYDFELPDSTLIGTVNFFIGEYPGPNSTQAYPSYVTMVQNGCSVTLGLRWED